MIKLMVASVSTKHIGRAMFLVLKHKVLDKTVIVIATWWQVVVLLLLQAIMLTSITAIAKFWLLLLKTLISWSRKAIVYPMILIRKIIIQ